ncbi:hypothetical protein ACIQXI_09610 [Lysinibacillus sp. NPDC097195]|uniref:hypothetical protein n=1 Tax=Lysinibacillus sp. NPDC097195 TaxID=3364141 RepID=UPI00380FED22
MFKQPEGHIIFDGEQHRMPPSKFEWKEDNTEARFKSSADLNELADHFETLEVKKGELLEFDIEKNPISIAATQLNEDDTIENIEVNDASIAMPAKEGYYLYEVNVLWHNGKETFIFDVNVK